MIKQGTSEWLTARVGKVTGSVAAGILGISPWQTRDDVMRRMVRDAHGATSEFPGNPATAWGTAMEATARADYEMDMQVTVEDAPFVVHPTETWIGASPDGYVGKDGLVELKAPYGIRNDNPPVFKRLREQGHYECQCQIEMYVTGRKWLSFYQWTPFGQLLERTEPNADWLTENLPRLKQFHAEFMDACASPEQYLEPRRAVLDTPAAHKMVREFDDLSEAIERATERKKEVLAELVVAAGGKDSLVAGRRLTLTRRAGSVAYAKALKAAAPGFDVEPFRGAATEFWGLK